eukprot:195529-Chlamydomonas_euryale.AAC.1
MPHPAGGQPGGAAPNARAAQAGGRVAAQRHRHAGILAAGVSRPMHARHPGPAARPPDREGSRRGGWQDACAGVGMCVCERVPMAGVAAPAAPRRHVSCPLSPVPRSRAHTLPPHLHICAFPHFHTVQVVLKWNTQRGVPLAAKASSEAHQRENFEGFFEWKLTNAQKARLDEMDEGRRFVDFDWHEWAPAEEGGVTKPSTVVF